MTHLKSIVVSPLANLHLDEYKLYYSFIDRNRQLNFPFTFSITNFIYFEKKENIFVIQAMTH